MPIDSSRWLRRRRRRRPTRRDGRRRARGLGAAGDVRTTVAIVGALAVALTAMMAMKRGGTSIRLTASPSSFLGRQVGAKLSQGEIGGVAGLVTTVVQKFSSQVIPHHERQKKSESSGPGGLRLHLDLGPVLRTLLL